MFDLKVGLGLWLLRNNYLFFFYLFMVFIRLYYQYIPERKEYPVLCRKLTVESTNWVKHMVNYARRGFVNEEILLDWNEIAKEHGK